MKTGITAMSGLLLLGVATGGAAVAQPIYGAPPPPYFRPLPPPYAAPPPMYRRALPPQAIVAAVRAAGLNPVSRPVRRGPRRYVLVAYDAAGQRLRVVVSALNGRILRVQPVYAQRPGPRVAYGYPRPPAAVPAPRYAAPPPVHRELKDVPPNAVGPQPGTRMVPPARVTRTPQGSGAEPHRAARPAKTPMPRPRPVLAANEAALPPPAEPQARPSANPPVESKPTPAARAPEPAEKAPQLVPVAPLE